MIISPPLPTIGEPNSSADADVLAALTAILSEFNGNIEGTNLKAALAEVLGVSQGGAVRRGKSIIATEESRTNTAYGLLATPDRVQSVVLPTDGLIAVAYQAMWKESVAGAASAALFVGASQVVAANPFNTGPEPVVAAAGLGVGAADVYKPLATGGKGLVSARDGQQVSTSAYTGDVSTGQVLGSADAAKDHIPGLGPCYIFAAAGTYDVSVQFTASSGTVTAKQRKLWVWTLGF